MAEELDPGDALRQLLEERERAKRAVYAANMAREKAEEELAYSEKLFKMEIEEAQKLALELAQERAENKEWRTKRLLADEQVARERNEFKERAEKAEKREKILETILSRIEDELHDAILEEDEFDPLEDPLLKAASVSDIHDFRAFHGDPHEGPHGQEKPFVKSDIPFGNFGHTFGGAIIKAALFIRPRWQVFSFAVAAPFALMTLALGLASAGVYIDALRPLWSPWPDDAIKWAVGIFGTLVFTLIPLLFTFLPLRGRDNQGRPEPPVPDELPAKSPDEDDDYLATLKEIFGEDDDDEKDEGTPDEE